MFCSRLSSARLSSSSSSPASTESRAACCCPGPEYEMVSWSRTWARGHWTLDTGHWTRGHTGDTWHPPWWGACVGPADTRTRARCARRGGGAGARPRCPPAGCSGTWHRAEAGHSGNSANEKFFIELHVILFEHNKLLCARWCETKIIVTVDIRYYDLGL